MSLSHLRVRHVCLEQCVQRYVIQSCRFQLKVDVLLDWEPVKILSRASPLINALVVVSESNRP